VNAPVAVSSINTTIPVLSETRGFRAWWTRNVIGTDHTGTYSRLDRMDGLDNRREVSS
jgi:hypothetical protein